MKKLNELMDLKGRKALVTGGAGHIGEAVCETLSELGAVVAVCDLDAEETEKKTRRWKKEGFERCIPFACDLLDEAKTRSLVSTVARELGGLDILIHAAAYVGSSQMEGWAVPFEKQSVAAWDKALRVNVTSAFVLSQAAQPYLSKSGSGSLILFSSIYGMSGPQFDLYEGTQMVNPAAYGVSKGGILQLTRHLAALLAPKVRVNSISPGGVSRGQPENFQKKYCQKTPLKRMATEEDMKGAVAFLASDLSRYVTGHNLVVDGGFTAW